MWNKHGKTFFSLVNCKEWMKQMNELTYVTVVFFFSQYSLNPLYVARLVFGPCYAKWRQQCYTCLELLVDKWSEVQSILSHAFRDLFYINLNVLASPISRVMTYRWSIYRSLYWQYTIIMTYCWRRLQYACQMKGGPIELLPCFQGCVLRRFKLFGITNFKSHDLSLKTTAVSEPLDYHLSDPLFAVHIRSV